MSNDECPTPPRASDFPFLTAVKTSTCLSRRAEFFDFPKKSARLHYGLASRQTPEFATPRVIGRKTRLPIFTPKPNRPGRRLSKCRAFDSAGGGKTSSRGRVSHQAHSVCCLDLLRLSPHDGQAAAIHHGSCTFRTSVESGASDRHDASFLSHTAPTRHRLAFRPLPAWCVLEVGIGHSLSLCKTLTVGRMVAKHPILVSQRGK